MISYSRCRIAAGWTCLFVVSVLATQVTSAGEAQRHRWTAADLAAAGQLDRLHLTDAGLRLVDGELLEDDGPAAGYSYQPHELRLDDQTHLKKQFLIPDATSRRARLLVAPGGQLQAKINQKPVALELEGKQGNYWQSYRFDARSLRTGLNEIELFGTGKVWIARADDFAAGSDQRTQHPNRSQVSRDAGRTWNDRSLGTDPQTPVDGEYLVRLHLERFPASGTLTLPVWDTGNLAGNPVGPPLSAMPRLAIRPQADTPAGTSVTVEARTGTHAAPDADGWSQWRPLDSSGALPNPSGRFLQLRLQCATSDPLATPTLRALEISADVPIASPWHEAIRVERSSNPPVTRSSVPFQYERFDRPELAALRKQYRLDEIAQGAATEFELIKRLADWSSRQFTGGHLGEIYPAWNALEILKPHTDGRPVGGFCQQYNVVFLQACQSFGLVGRAVSIGPGNRLQQIRSGHEVVEIWSNDFRKWIYVDGQMGWYFKDPQSEAPLSLLELRERQLDAFEPGKATPKVQVVYLRPDPEKTWMGLDDWPAFVELRVIPRNNFLEKPSPLPLNQGMRGWFWTGHYVWRDELEPARPTYVHYVTNPSDFEWSLNHAHLRLVATDQPGVVNVHFDLAMPDFERYTIEANGGPIDTTAVPARWTLQPGPNRLTVQPINAAGRPGATTEIQLRYDRP